MKRLLCALSLVSCTVGASASATSLLDDTAGVLTDIAESRALDVQLLLPGFSKHFSEPQQKDKQWNETNWGAGIALRKPLKEHEPWSLVAPIGAMQDSLYKWGWYAGIGVDYRVGEAGPFSFSAGVTATLMHRTLRWGGRYVYVGAFVPSFSVLHTSRFGANFVVLPPRSMGSQSPGVALMQFTYSF